MIVITTMIMNDSDFKIASTIDENTEKRISDICAGIIEYIATDFVSTD